MPQDHPHVVIVGAGFGGLACAQALGGQPVHVTVIDRHNYHLFQPLLYQVATAALSPADIAEPVRRILRRHANVEVRMGEVRGVDTAARQVLLTGGTRIPYDRLVVATGSVYSYFGHEAEWADHAPGLKTIENAREIRARLLYAFEAAEICNDEAERRRLMTAIVIGGGPTGVEMAGSIAELARFTLSRDFRHINPAEARILLLEGGPRILATFPEDLGNFAHRALEDKGVTVMTGTMVESIQADGVVAGGQKLPAATMVWGAGVKASPAAAWLGVTPAAGGRIAVDADLSVPGLAGVYAIGDTALARDDTDTPLPGLAQVAKQQGAHLGRGLARELAGGAPVAPFRFRNRGNTAIVGRNAAVFDFGRRRLKGRLAWVLWAIVHVWLLVNFEKRLLVTVQWLWRWLTYQRGARLITREPPESSRQN